MISHNFLVKASYFPWQHLPSWQNITGVSFRHLGGKEPHHGGDLLDLRPRLLLYRHTTSHITKYIVIVQMII